MADSGSQSLGSGLSAKPFIPNMQANAKEFVPRLSSDMGSKSNLSAMAVEAAEFRPGGSRASVDAQPFIPGATKATTTPPLGSSPPQDSVILPEDDDDLLGMKSVVPGGSKDLASQAADMLKSFNPLSIGSAGRGGGATTTAGGRGPPPSLSSTMQYGNTAATSSQRGRGRGRGRGANASTRGGPTNASGFRHQLGPGKVVAASRFMPESMREDLARRNYLIMATYDADTLHSLGIPDSIQQYHTLCPLEDVSGSNNENQHVLGVNSIVLKGIHAGDGKAYAVRKVDGRQVVPTAELLEAAQDVVHKWAQLSEQPYIVALREVFASDEVEGTPSVFFSHDYYPGALTLEEVHLLPTTNAQGAVVPNTPPTEQQLWSYLVQLACAIRAAHSVNVAFHPISFAPTKVLVTAPGRVRMGSIGVAEVLLSEGAPQVDISKRQQDDLVALGTLILTLACSGRGTRPSLDVLMTHHSRELCQVVAGLLASAEGTGFTSWRSLITALGDRVFIELESTGKRCDEIAAEAQKECENGRLLRLMMKLAMINERAEVCGDDQWAETGDRYLLKLFRDFVFHQVDEAGAPNMDWGPIVEALNKADAGLEERILLLSRDEAAMLVVSYADIKRCIDMAYNELKQASSSSLGADVGKQSGQQQF